MYASSDVRYFLCNNMKAMMVKRRNKRKNKTEKEKEKEENVFMCCVMFSAYM